MGLSRSLCLIFLFASVAFAFDDHNVGPHPTVIAVPIVAIIILFCCCYGICRACHYGSTNSTYVNTSLHLPPERQVAPHTIVIQAPHQPPYQAPHHPPYQAPHQPTYQAPRQPTYQAPYAHYPPPPTHGTYTNHAYGEQYAPLSEQNFASAPPPEHSLGSTPPPPYELVSNTKY